MNHLVKARRYNGMPKMQERQFKPTNYSLAELAHLSNTEISLIALGILLAVIELPVLPKSFDLYNILLESDEVSKMCKEEEIEFDSSLCLYQFNTFVSLFVADSSSENKALAALSLATKNYLNPNDETFSLIDQILAEARRRLFLKSYEFFTLAKDNHFNPKRLEEISFLVRDVIIKELGSREISKE